MDPVELQAALYIYGVSLDVEQARKLVAAVDKNDDGEVSLTELRSLADYVQQRTLVRDMFLKMDKDGSGAVDPEELAQGESLLSIVSRRPWSPAQEPCLALPALLVVPSRPSSPPSLPTPPFSPFSFSSSPSLSCSLRTLVSIAHVSRGHG